MVLAVGLSCYNFNARTQTRGWSRRRLSLANAVCTPIDRALPQRLPEGSSREPCSASIPPRELLLITVNSSGSTKNERPRDAFIAAEARHVSPFELLKLLRRDGTRQGYGLVAQMIQ